jgi:hypothetical protein
MTSTGETAFSLIMRAKSVAGMKQSSWLMIFRSRFGAIAEYDPGRCAFIPIQGACSCATVIMMWPTQEAAPITTVTARARTSSGES